MFNYRKIASVLSSALMIGSTVGLAAAANYPDPYVTGGNADVAVVYGTTAAITDLVAVTDITANLQAKLAAQTATTTGGTTGTVSGEAVELFTSSKKIYLNDSLNKERNLVTDSNLPVALADGNFEGDVSATYDNKIEISSTTGQNSRLVYGLHPTSNDDPIHAFKIGTVAANPLYNLTVVFNKAIAFNHSDSEGETLKLFGTEYTVSSATDGTDIVLLKSSKRVSLSSDDPSTEVTVDDKTYTVEMVSSSDSAATVKVTNSEGVSESKEISEGTSKTVNKLEVGVDTADETNLKLSATLLVGANRIKLRDNTAVKFGADETNIDGTNVRFGDSGSQRPNNITKLTFQIAAKDTDVDALIAGGEFIDPVFGSIKVFLTGLNIPEVSTAREEIVIAGSGSDKATLKFQSWEASEAKTINFYYNTSTSLRADGRTTIGYPSLADSNGFVINTFEMAQINKSEFAVVGNENNGGLWKLKTVSNDTSSVTKTTIEFENVFTGTVQKATVDGQGTGTVELGGRSYTIIWRDNRNVEGDEFVRLRYQDGSRSTANNMVMYPTIQTKKGGKLFFYEPVVVNLTDWDGTSIDGGAAWTNLSKMRFPDGDGYTDATFLRQGVVTTYNWSVQFGSGTIFGLNTSITSSADGAIGQLTYNVSTLMVGSTSINDTIQVRLEDVSGAVINLPSIVITEEQDDSSSQLYEALIVKMEGNGVSDAKVGVSDVETTWSLDTAFDEIQMKSNSKLYKSADFWGSIITTDQSATDSYIATISYPDQQVYALVYAGAVESSATGGTVGGGTVKELGSVSVSDAETSSVSTKNWVVVGGSCVNTAAASLLGSSSPLCGDNWMSKTGVGSGQFLIETFSRTGGKVATLVAGYNAGDTSNAAKYLTTQTVDTMAGKKYIGTSATSATLQTTTNSTA